MKEGQEKSGLEAGFYMVGETGFEPATSRSQTARATKLRHSPLS